MRLVAETIDEYFTAAAERSDDLTEVAAVTDGETPAEHGRDPLGRAANGRNCIRFRRVAGIDTDELADAMRDAADWAAVQEEQFERNCAAPVDDPT